VNLLRNIGVERVTSPYVLVLDADMVPSHGLELRFDEFARDRGVLEEDDPGGGGQAGLRQAGFSLKQVASLGQAGLGQAGVGSVLRRLKTNPKIAFVLPAYEVKEGSVLPKTKSELLGLVEKGEARPFYSQVCWKCQKYTDFARWERAVPGVEGGLRRDWADPWEPFYIAEKAQMPLYDERFKQYGFNRIQQVCELHVSGFQFQVLDDAFVLHHGFKEKSGFHDAKQVENDRNRELFRTFKRELKRKYPHTDRRC